MARHRRRSRRRRNPLGKADLMTIGLAATGGALAIYLYLKPYISTTPVLTTSTTPGA